MGGFSSKIGGSFLFGGTVEGPNFFAPQDFLNLLYGS